MQAILFLGALQGQQQLVALRLEVDPGVPGRLAFRVPFPSRWSIPVEQGKPVAVIETKRSGKLGVLVSTC